MFQLGQVALSSILPASQVGYGVVLMVLLTFIKIVILLVTCHAGFIVYSWSRLLSQKCRSLRQCREWLSDSASLNSIWVRLWPPWGTMEKGPPQNQQLWESEKACMRPSRRSKTKSEQTQEGKVFLIQNSPQPIGFPTRTSWNSSDC